MSELISFHSDVKNSLEQARRKARSALHSAMAEAYGLMGRRIVEEEQGKSRAKYGKGILKNLAKALSATFDKSFSDAHFRNFRKFHLTYPVQEILYTTCRELSWSHPRLMTRVDSAKAFRAHCQQAHLCSPIWDTVRPKLSWNHDRLLIQLHHEQARACDLNEAAEPHRGRADCRN